MSLSDTAEVEYESGIMVTLRPMPNPDFDARMQQVRKPNLRKIRRGNLGGSEAEAMVKDAIAHAVVKGWTNLEDENGVTIPYSPEKCLEFFSDPQLYDFYQFCRQESTNIDNFRKEDEEDGVGN